MDAAAPLWKQRFIEEKQVLADWEQTPAGEYRVRLKLLEYELPLLEMTISLPTREQAVGFCARWPKAAGEIYAGLMRNLGDEADAREHEDQM